MKFENSLQYVTFADRTQVENRTDDYDSLILPSHLLSGGKKAVTALLKNLIEDDGVEYYIDPTASQFRRGRNFRNADDSLKAWHSKLVAELGYPFTLLQGDEKNIIYQELDRTDRIGAIESVCDFQQSFVANSVEENVGKYEIIDTSNLYPRAIIPWYTKVHNYEELAINKEIISHSIDYCDLPVKPCIHITMEFLRDANARNAISELVKEFELAEVFLWIDDFDKTEANVTDYFNAIDLVAKVSTGGVRPHFLFGNYFSNLLFFFGLRGTSYGTYFRESSAEKTENYSGGGGNLQRFYFDPVKDFLSIPDAIDIAKEGGADTPTFSQLTSWDDLYRLGEDHDFLKNHFIKTKKGHKELILSNELEPLLEELNECYDTYDNLLSKRKTNKNVSHLKKWRDGIQLFIKNHPDVFEEKMEEAIQLQT
ncbi:hypothetical protein [Haladaptatus sp. ZSTT2]|uniref:hypothetical protein n=1 Tax=Haladaptatus sp. ZSTT2 TaxID=3120515 RepID=UPI00300EDF38